MESRYEWIEAQVERFADELYRRGFTEQDAALLVDRFRDRLRLDSERERSRLCSLKSTTTP